MKSVGNDVVALLAIDIQRTILPAFYSKIITPAEHELYHQPGFTAIPFQNFVWLLWSVKESVYKYLQRLNPTLVFSPTKITVQHIGFPDAQPIANLPGFEWQSDDAETDFYTGIVLYQSTQLYFRSKITDQYIASVVNNAEDFKGVYWGVKKIGDATQANQSAAVREFALMKLRSILGSDEVRIEKTAEGIPVVFKDGVLVDVPVSLAHHGRFVGYCFSG